MTLYEGKKTPHPFCSNNNEFEDQKETTMILWGVTQSLVVNNHKNIYIYIYIHIYTYI